MLLVTRNQRLCPSIDRMSSLGSDDKGRVFITTSTGSAKVSIASINSTTSRLLYADALTCSERRATSRYSKPSVRSISGTSSSQNIIRTTSPAAHHSTGQPSRTMPYRAQSSQSHDTTHDATQSAVLRESGKGTALLPLPPLRTGLDGFPHPAQAACKLCPSRTGRPQRTDICDSGKLT
jgi:hypothetical protein